MKSHKKKIRLNQYTGQPRKWVCTNCRRIDEKLEKLEAEYLRYIKGPSNVPEIASPQFLGPDLIMDKELSEWIEGLSTEDILERADLLEEWSKQLRRHVLAYHTPFKLSKHHNRWN